MHSSTHLITLPRASSLYSALSPFPFPSPVKQVKVGDVAQGEGMHACTHNRLDAGFLSFCGRVEKMVRSCMYVYEML